MIGIGEYESKTQDFTDLNGVKTDYKNMLKLFIQHLNYSFIYQTSKNQMVYLTKDILIKNNNSYNSNFKIKWNENEIDTFVLNCKKIINKIKSDSLIFLISSRGNKDEYIFDSEGNKYEMIKILNEFNNTQQTFVQLKNKPKLFIVDLCDKGSQIQHHKKRNLIRDDHESDTKSSEIYSNDSQDKKNINNTNESKEQQIIKQQQGTSNESEKSQNDKSGEFNNFCVIYKDMKLSHFGIDGIEDGGFLIRGLKNALKNVNQHNNVCIELNQVIELLKHEVLVLITNEEKEWNQEYDVNSDKSFQIYKCNHCNSKYYCQNGGEFINIVQHRSTMTKMLFFVVNINGASSDKNQWKKVSTAIASAIRSINAHTTNANTNKDNEHGDNPSIWYHNCFLNTNNKKLDHRTMCYVTIGTKDNNCKFGHNDACIVATKSISTMQLLKPLHTDSFIKLPVVAMNESRGKIEVLKNGDGIQIRGISSFGSFRGNFNLEFGYKWYYEIKLDTNELMQLGFATNKCQTNELKGEGIGDCANSWAIDGKRLRLWHNGKDEAWLELTMRKWRVNDVITLVFDCVNRESCNMECYIHDARTGMSVPVTSIANKEIQIIFANIDLSHKDVNNIFPCFTLQKGQQVTVVFDQDKMTYPLKQTDGYRAVNTSDYFVNTH